MQIVSTNTLRQKNAKLPEEEKELFKSGVRERKVESFGDAKKSAIKAQEAVQKQRDTYKDYLKDLQNKDLEKARLAEIKKITDGRKEWLKAQRMEYAHLQIVLYGFHRDAKYMVPAKQQKVRQKRLDKIVNTDYFKDLDEDTKRILKEARTLKSSA